MSACSRSIALVVEFMAAVMLGNYHGDEVRVGL
jgi:hypothetical protein